MSFRHPHLTVTNVVAYILFAVSAAILTVVVAFTFQIQVLQNWHLVLPPGNIHEGDTIVVQSVYTKLRSVTGQATRYIECQDQNGLYIRYPLNEVRADHAPGSGGTGIELKMPANIPNVPAICRISVNVTYRVYPWRSVTEFASSKNFTLLPVGATSPVALVVAEPQAAIESSPSVVPVAAPSVSIVANSSPTQSAPVQEPTQPETSQQPGQQSGSLVASILNILQSASNGLGL